MRGAKQQAAVAAQARRAARTRARHQPASLSTAADWRCTGRYAALRELIPSKEKSDKATFLQQVVEYVRALQVRRVRACASRLRSRLGARCRSGCALRAGRPAAAHGVGHGEQAARGPAVEHPPARAAQGGCRGCSDTSLCRPGPLSRCFTCRGRGGRARSARQCRGPGRRQRHRAAGRVPLLALQHVNAALQRG